MKRKWNENEKFRAKRRAMKLRRVISSEIIEANYISCPCRSESPRKSGAFSEWSELS